MFVWDITSNALQDIRFFNLACKPSLLLLRIAVVICIIMIILLMVLIAYDTLVLIDPTRCFFLNCNDALVYQSNSTSNSTVSGWPLYISWPSYFQTNMNAKRIFQAIQLLCAGLFILFAALYLLTFFIYRYIRLEHQQPLTNLERQRPDSHEVSQTKYITRHPSPAYSNPSSYSNRKVTVYMIDAHRQPETMHTLPVPPPTVTTSTRPLMTSTLTPKPARRPRASSVTYERLCTRCYKEPRLILRTPYERENFFGHLCVNCNKDLIQNRPRPIAPSNNKSPRAWKP